jgi:uncharacterized protein YbjT (DUF2867 family)
MASILILGATGYIGGKLIAPLLEAGHKVHCIVRSASKAKHFPDAVTVHVGDALQKDSLMAPLTGIDVVYYLIHSMGEGEDFVAMERSTAENVRDACAEAGVGRIIYLGGLGDDDGVESKHLKSRHAVGTVLRSGRVAVTEFRAAVIVGSGSASFEMVHHLVNKLPIMICPRWLVVKTQPISLSDVLRYLVSAIEVPESAGKILDIGGPEILTYRSMMLTVAKVLGLRRFLIQVPVLTPRLSSYWVNLVTPIRASMARILIESVRHETICRNDTALKMFAFQPMSYEQAVRRTLHPVLVGNAMLAVSAEGGIDRKHLLIDTQTVTVHASANTTFGVVSSIGGSNGWYYANWLWEIRGWIDERVGGVGLRRGRINADILQEGELLDFWRVESYEPAKLLRLRSEMRMWGKAWLEFSVGDSGNQVAILTQKAYYYPKGVLGYAYWYCVYPLHHFVFRGMIRAIRQRAES